MDFLPIDVGSTSEGDTLSFPMVQGVAFNRRAIAYGLDFALINAISYAGSSLFNQLTIELLPVLRQLLHIGITFTDSSVAMNYAIGFCLTVVYFSLFEWVFGATPGKWLLRMRVVDLDGQPCNLGAALVRGVARLIDGLVFGVIAFTNMKPPLHQRLGDKLAHTLVISSRDPFLKSARSSGHALLAIALFSFLVFPIIQAVRIAASVEKVTSMIDSGADGFNLSLGDLDSRYSLKYDHAQLKIPNSNYWDDNARLFEKRAGSVYSQVTLLSFLPTLGDTANTRKFLEEFFSADFSTSSIEFKAQKMAPAGRPGLAVRYVEKDTGRNIVMLVNLQQNARVIMLLYGAPEEVDIDRVEAFAKIVLERIQSNDRVPIEGKQLSAWKLGG